MPKGHLVLTESQRSEIIQRVTNKGEKVTHLAREYDVILKLSIICLKIRLISIRL